VRTPLVMIIVTLVALFVVACGGSGKDRASRSSAPSSTTSTDSSATAIPKADSDKDVDGGPQDDTSDSVVLDFGHPAGTRDRRAIAQLVKRYYGIAVNEEGSRACALIATPLSKSVAEDYGQSPGPAYARGKTCTAVMTLFFRHFHSQLATRLPQLAVSHVQVSNRRGLAVLKFGAMPERQMPVVREGTTWKVESILDYDVP
jgi:hypothetical protein